MAAQASLRTVSSRGPTLNPMSLSESVLHVTSVLLAGCQVELSSVCCWYVGASGTAKAVARSVVRKIGMYMMGLFDPENSVSR